MAIFVGAILTIPKHLVNENPVCSPRVNGRGDPSLLREQLILVINENRDLKPPCFDNIDLSEGGTHAKWIQGVRDFRFT